MSNQCDVSSSQSKTNASVFVMLHLSPVCDPQPFLGLLRLKSQVKLMPLSPGNSNPLVLRHYPVIDGALEESMLEGEERERGDINKKDEHSSCCRPGTDLEEIQDSEAEKVEDPH